MAFYTMSAVSRQSYDPRVSQIWPSMVPPIPAYPQHVPISTIWIQVQNWLIQCYISKGREPSKIVRLILLNQRKVYKMWTHLYSDVNAGVIQVLSVRYESATVTNASVKADMQWRQLNLDNIHSKNPERLTKQEAPETKHHQPWKRVMKLLWQLRIKWSCFGN